ncbi:MAG: type II toxin-antitoxin system HigB family toxin [Candidatus Cyclonatronum sp.]|uniref:type II toxin-antitoxin system HigB family toxin n=1 Tax=Cyclonatronum sp. TaxID=3024185 RepID=UPI0025C104F9|nr:type II toxin-antitoxin system HigB family toxin [Cyclonatronum sp.]MCH8487217.1 type II toxin-antitoxin system HigB family toxin [Cyclonatronum sp.]
MKIHLIKEQTIWSYAEGHASSKPAFANWLRILRAADWEQPEDMAQTFGAADLLGKGSNRVVFNIGGNNHRLICKYTFGAKQVHLFIAWIGTHAEYTKLCDNQEQYTVAHF